MQLIKKYTFDRFIAGDSNRLAYTAAKAVADNPGKVYNPLVILGKSGVGKTHLLNATGNRLSEQVTGMSIAISSANELLYQMVGAVRLNLLDMMYDRLCAYDALLIDDMHSLLGKQCQQAWLAKLIHDFTEAGKQVVLTSSVPIEQLSVIDAEFRLNFHRGLIVDIQPLNRDICRQIGVNMGAKLEMPISEEILENIVAHSCGDARRIEGIISQLYAKRVLAGAELSVDTVEKICRGLSIPTDIPVLMEDG